MSDASTDRNFILQQGLEAPALELCPILTSALLFQPRVIGVWTVLGVVLQSPAVFAALAATVWWSAALPAWNPFDAVFNRVTLAWRPHLPRLEPAPPPRRAAQAIAGAMAATIAALLQTGAVAAAMLVAGALLLAVAALVFGRFCFGSFVYHLMRGRVAFALRTLPWSRGDA